MRYAFTPIKLNVRNFEGKVIFSHAPQGNIKLPKREALQGEICLEVYSEFKLMEGGYYFRYIYPHFYHNSYGGSLEIIICVDDMAKQLESLFDVKVSGYIFQDGTQLSKISSDRFVPVIRDGKRLSDVSFDCLTAGTKSSVIEFGDDYYLVYGVGNFLNYGGTVKADFIVADTVTGIHDENFTFFIQYTLISCIMLILAYISLKIGIDLHEKKNKSEKNELIKAMEGKSQELSYKISDYEKKEKALSKSEEKLELALKGGELGMWEWDRSKDEITGNERLFEIFGYGKGELQLSMRKWLTMIHPDDVARVKEVQHLFSFGNPDSYRLEYRMKKKNGKCVWISMTSLLTEKNEKGEAVRLSGVVNDISERKGIVRKLRMTLERQEAIFENSLVSIAYLEDGVIVKVNGTFLETFGYFRKEIIGESLANLKICNKTECFQFLQ